VNRHGVNWTFFASLERPHTVLAHRIEVLCGQADPQIIFRAKLAVTGKLEST
jgi:hypothetical protein